MDKKEIEIREEQIKQIKLVLGDRRFILIAVLVAVAMFGWYFYTDYKDFQKQLQTENIQNQLKIKEMELEAATKKVDSEKAAQSSVPMSPATSTVTKTQSSCDVQAESDQLNILYKALNNAQINLAGAQRDIGFYNAIITASDSKKEKDATKISIENTNKNIQQTNDNIAAINTNLELVKQCHLLSADALEGYASYEKHY